MKQILLVGIILISLSSVAAATGMSTDEAGRQQRIDAAVQLRSEGKYVQAIAQLDSILQLNSNDKQILLFKGDLQLQARQFGAAVQTYTSLLTLDYQPTVTEINLSYALFMSHRPAKALQHARHAWEKNQADTFAAVNYFNAMLWNMHTKNAAEFLARLKLKPAVRLVLEARLNMASGNYTKGISYYDSLVRHYPDQHTITEYAEVLIGKKRIQEVQQLLHSDSNYVAGQSYTTGIRDKLKAAQLQQVGTEAIYFSDIAHNTRYENYLWWKAREGRQYQWQLKMGMVKNTSADGAQTKAGFVSIAANEYWSAAWSGRTELVLQQVDMKDQGAFSGVLFNQQIKYQPNDRRMLALSYNNEILNYTASLLGQNIRAGNLGYETHILLTSKTGIYSQGGLGFISDQNRRYRFFGSLYHLFRTAPVVKAGINFSALHYTDPSIKNYFSPGQYLNTEAFGEFDGTIAGGKCHLQLQGAIGMQRIEQRSWEPSVRGQAEIGTHVKNVEAAFRYLMGNVSSASGTGYGYQQASVRVIWHW